MGEELAGQSCVVQGFGKVGAVAAHELALRGAKVIAVSDISGGIHDEEGLDLDTLDVWRHKEGAVEGFPGSRTVTNAELLELPCDVLVLAATERQLTGENAPRIQTRVVAEGANGPTTLDADEILLQRGIPVLPDILTNAGGVAVSYFEWVQDIQRLFWKREEIRTKLADLMDNALDRVWTLSQAEDLSMRRAALVCSIREVSSALATRGTYP
jgi:glutamate dehydrogenase (NAD(P)+)